MVGRIKSVQIGRSQCFDSEGDSLKPWSSAIIKKCVDGTIYVGGNGLEGDEQADLVHHGGHDKAVLAYADKHYPYWQELYPDAGFVAGGFGENLTVSDMDETTCCIGDVFEIGSCLLQISQPRQPCWKLSRRWGIPTLTAEVQDVRFTGWYMRVLKHGNIEAGDLIHLKDRPHPELTVTWALSVMYAKPRSVKDDLQLACCPVLSRSWRENLLTRNRYKSSEDESLRLLGPSN